MTPMTPTQYRCRNQRRRELVQAAVDENGSPFLNGIDFLEVSPADQRELTVTFLHPLPGQAGGVPDSPQLTEGNFVVDGGVRVTAVRVQAVHQTDGMQVVLRTDRAGDFSTYVLRLVSSPVTLDPPTGFDPVLAAVPFSFKVHCDRGLDCEVPAHRPEATSLAPHLGYLAKDYASLRRLVLDRLSETMPAWRERSPADLGIALVDLFAYVGDHLSYYQDSVATEAYLGTARRRASARRHARLVDYAMHDGANARTWLVFHTDADRGTVAQAAIPAGRAVVVASDQVAPDDRRAVVFETVHDLPRLLVTRNALRFHTWGDDDCCLPRGATRATLTGIPGDLGLARGDVLILEEVLGAATGRPEDADRTHRHPVRLAADPVGSTDPLTGTGVTEISWSDEDALPFPLRLTEFDDGAGGTALAAVARGNVALADHGRTYVTTVPGEDLVPARVPTDGRYRPVLNRVGLTHAAPYDHDAAATTPALATTSVDASSALPVIRLAGAGESWRPRRDLLGSDRFAADFVVEMEDDGRAHLRFGDGVLGRRPAEGTAFLARYRLGVGTAGNVGAEALSRLVEPIPGVSVRNPLPAVGGVDPEPIEKVRLEAPQAFRRQERAVTPADYAVAAERHPGVSRAAATMRWTGSWHTVFVTVDRRGGRPVDDAFRVEIRQFLERFRMAGYDLEVDAPHFVSVDLAMTVCVRPDHDPAVVRSALVSAFGTGVRADGRPGFFHPDRLTFGQPIYLSQVLTHAADVPGVERILRIDRFGRFGEDPHGEIEQGILPIHRLEIAQLDNNPSAVERGRFELVVQGGI
jgi:hypothetical protein